MPLAKVLDLGISPWDAAPFAQRHARHVPGLGGADGLPTSFGAGEASAGLRKASEFLFHIDSGKAWDDLQELFKTPSVLEKYDKDYEYWISEANDANNDLRRAKQMLQESLEQQAEQPEDQKPQTQQE